MAVAQSWGLLSRKAGVIAAAGGARNAMHWYVFISNTAKSISASACKTDAG